MESYTGMSQKEIIKRVIEFRDPPRIGMRFKAEGYLNDIYILPGIGSVHDKFRETPWGYEPGILEQVPGFEGQVKTDIFGNIWGRLEELTKGECIKGILENGWDGLDEYRLPVLETESINAVREAAARNNHRYLLALLPGLPFSIMRCMRKFENFLADILLYEEEVIKLRNRVTAYLMNLIDGYASAGADGIYAGEDWGTQNSLLISPASWRKIFKPCFQAVSERVHERGMHFILHSCGYIYEIIEDLIETGVDVFQFDQPQLVGLDRLSGEFGGRAAFWSPVDIQHVMPDGDKNRIENEARQMIVKFGGFHGGFIAADYTDWESINVRQEWADWARKVFTAEGGYDNGQEKL